MGEMRNAYRVLMGKPQGMRTLGRRRRRLRDNITTDYEEIEWEGVECIDLAQDTYRWRAVVSSVMNLRVL